MDKIGILKKIGIFDEVDDSSLEKIASICDEETFNTADTILKEDTPGTQLYMIVEGEVCITINALAEEGLCEDKIEKEAFIGTMGEGEIFGEMCLINGESRSANVKALTPTKLINLPYNKLYKFIEQDYKTGYIIMRNIAKLISSRLRDDNLSLKYKALLG